MSKDNESLVELEEEINTDQSKCAVLVAWDEVNEVWRVVRCDENGSLKVTTT